MLMGSLYIVNIALTGILQQNIKSPNTYQNQNDNISCHDQLPQLQYKIRILDILMELSTFRPHSE